MPEIRIDELTKKIWVRQATISIIRMAFRFFSPYELDEWLQDSFFLSKYMAHIWSSFGKGQKKKEKGVFHDMARHDTVETRLTIDKGNFKRQSKRELETRYLIHSITSNPDSKLQLQVTSSTKMQIGQTSSRGWERGRKQRTKDWTCAWVEKLETARQWALSAGNKRRQQREETRTRQWAFYSLV